MNPFVNANKRSISLPPGCKDLADVLKPRRRRIAKLDMPIAWGQIPTIEPVRFERAGLIHLRKYVAEVFSAGTVQPSLHIRTLDGLRGVSLYRTAAEFSIIPVPDTAERSRQIEDFFAKRGMQANYDQVIGSSDIAGGSMRILTFPLPQGVLATTQLTSDLLREVYGVDDQAGLEFTSVDLKAA